MNTVGAIEWRAAPMDSTTLQDSTMWKGSAMWVRRYRRKQTRSCGVWVGFYLYAGQPQQRDRAAAAGYLDDTESGLLSKTHIELTDPAQPGHMTPATAA